MDNDNGANSDNSYKIRNLYDRLLFDDEFQKIRAKTLKEITLDKQVLLSDALKRSISDDLPPKWIGKNIAEEYKSQLIDNNESKRHAITRVKYLFTDWITSHPFLSGGGLVTTGFLLGISLSLLQYGSQPTFRGNFSESTNVMESPYTQSLEQKMVITNLTRKAQAGDPFAQNKLGDLYRYGKGVKQSSEKAINWYKKSAASGNYSAQYSLGMMYQSGEGVSASNSEADMWFERASRNIDNN